MFRIRALSRIYFAIFLLVGITLVGTFGFMYFEGYSVLEAFYMTIITISTVGYGEVRPLGDSGRVFTAVLIICTFGTFAFTVSVIGDYLMGGEYKNYLKRLKLEKKIAHLKNHVILCGYGRVGNKAARSLEQSDVPFVVIDIEELRQSKRPDAKDLLHLQGDATLDEVLLKAGINDAKALITTLPDDAKNLYTVLTAREMNSNLTIITRASKSESVKKLRIAGANNVIMPDSVGGVHMANLVVNPDVQEFLDEIAIMGGADVNLEEVTFTDVPTDFQYKTLGELEARNKIGINIIGLKNDTGDYQINPGPETQILPNSKFFVLGNRDQIRLFNRLMGIKTPY